MSKNAARTSKKAARTTGATKPKSAAKPAKPRAESKQSQLIAMLKQPDGATIAEIAKALHWELHTTKEGRLRLQNEPSQ